MTDDFHLFGDPSDGHDAIDPDIALVTAYLARELSPMQVLALEERLATDAEFRAEMQPLIDAWAAPVPALAHGLARTESPLSALERAESWRRFQSEGMPAAPSEPIVLAVRPVTTIRRISMKRVALLTAAVALPMVSFAQVVVYTANHAGLPGHVIARRVVSAFTHKAAVPDRRDATANPRIDHASSDLTDGRVPRPLSAAKMASPESAKALESPPAAATPALPSATPSAPKKSSVPDRALIAQLTRQHQPELVRGDTAAEYVVMVLDAADGYVWSTIGTGNLGIAVGADSRTPRERALFTVDYRDEFWGDSASWQTGRGRGMGGGFGAGAPGRGRGMASPVELDSTSRLGRGARGFGGRGSILSDSVSLVAGRGGRGAVLTTRIVRGDTIWNLRYDSMVVYTDVRGGLGPRAIGTDSGLRASGFGRARGVLIPQVVANSSGGYRAGWVGNAAGANGNRALGLEAPAAERSGIQGLGPMFVESADTYFFAPRELASSGLRVMVVHLTPNATWRGPS